MDRAITKYYKTSLLDVMCLSQQRGNWTEPDEFEFLDLLAAGCNVLLQALVSSDEGKFFKTMFSPAATTKHRVAACQWPTADADDNKNRRTIGQVRPLFDALAAD